MSEKQIVEVIEFINEIKEDESLPKSVKERLNGAISLLNSEDEVSIKVSRTIESLDCVCEDSNIDSFFRSQVLSVVSILESI